MTQFGFSLYFHDINTKHPVHKYVSHLDCIIWSSWPIPQCIAHPALCSISSSLSKLESWCWHVFALHCGAAMKKVMTTNQEATFSCSIPKHCKPSSITHCYKLLGHRLLSIHMSSIPKLSYFTMARANVTAWTPCKWICNTVVKPGL